MAKGRITGNVVWSNTSETTRISVLFEHLLNHTIVCVYISVHLVGTTGQLEEWGLSRELTEILINRRVTNYRDLGVKMENFYEYTDITVII